MICVCVYNYLLPKFLPKSKICQWQVNKINLDFVKVANTFWVNLSLFNIILINQFFFWNYEPRILYKNENVRKRKNNMNCFFQNLRIFSKLKKMFLDLITWHSKWNIYPDKIRFCLDFSLFSRFRKKSFYSFF